MRKWQSGAKQNARRVQALFDAVRHATPGTAESSWLDSLERDARRVVPGWRERFDAWLLGWEQAGGVTTALAEQWRREADACHSTSMRLEPVAFCVLWTLLVTLVTLAWQSALVSRLQGLVGCAVVALTGVIWAQRLGWLSSAGARASRWWLYALKAVAAGVCSLFVGMFAPGLFAELAKLGSYRTFERQQNEFLAVPTGYPWVRDFARREYGVDVVMTAPQEAWSRTTLHVLGSSSALMNSGNGLCELSISRESILNSFAYPPKQSLDVWVDGIMIHELTHCLNVRRDYAGQGGAWTGVRSIAPADRRSIDDGPGHYTVATKRETTQLWREALADMMAVGYWRLNTKPAEFKAMTVTLRTKRQASKEQDTIHATMCWIDLAAGAPGPTSNKELFAWSDALRSSVRCRLAVR